MGKDFRSILFKKENVYTSLFVKSNVNLAFQTKTQQVHEEYLLYDETGVIGSIGGTLGLFIGFSFRSIIINFFERIRNVIINDARS